MGTWRQHKGELHARPRAFSKASAQMVRMQCVLYPPDNDSNVQISPDNARRVRAPPGIASPSQGTKRTQKVPLALLGERQKKTVGEGCNETGARYINPQESR